MGSVLLLSAILSAIVGVAGIAASAGSTSATNKANAESVEKTNQANAEQAELAYQRSLPINQVNNLRAAGLSRAGALSHLSGAGVYTAPTMQSATQQPTNFDTSSLMQAINSIPANSEQARLNRAQIESIETDNEIKREQLSMQKSQLNQDLIEQKYSQSVREKKDEIMSDIYSRLSQNGVNWSSIHGLQDVIDGAKLNELDAWKNAPADVRACVIEQLSNVETLRQNYQSSKDSHTKVLDDLVNSEYGRTLSHYQVNKLKAETESVWQNVDDMRSSQNARSEEYKLREEVAQFERLMNSFNISKEELRKSLYKDKDGNWNSDFYITGVARQFWDVAGTIFGLDYIGNILSIIFKK